jgi:thiol-disulfide isomerase/thioredoxin
MNFYFYTIIIIIVILIISPLLYPQLLKLFSNKKKEKFTNNNKKIILHIYTADWCPHCIDFKSRHLQNLLYYYKDNKNIKIKNIDCTNDKNGETKTQKGAKVYQFPTFIVNIYENSEMKEINYEGNINSEDIISFLNKL